ncbi:MAG: hypothetical protein V4729_13495 [Pseudomonadota bacterium]
MDFPEPPLMDLATSTSFACPCCRQRIATWVVSPRFTCPSCEAPLTANKRQAFHRGLAAGTFVYLVLTALLYLLATRLPVLAVFVHLAGFIIAFYLGYFAYRRAVRITRLPG